MAIRPVNDFGEAVEAAQSGCCDATASWIGSIRSPTTGRTARPVIAGKGCQLVHGFQQRIGEGMIR